MRRIIVTFIIVFVSIVSFNSCTTYDEGPDFAILPVNTRIKGTWDQVKFYVNGTEETEITFEFKLDADGVGTRTFFLGSLGDTQDIEWKFNDDKTLLMFKETDSEEWTEATILRLTNSELWVTVDAGLFGIWEIHYEKV